MNTTDRTYANEIAYELRERGRWKRINQKDNFYYKGDVVNFGENFYPDGNSDYVGGNLEEIEIFIKKMDVTSEKDTPLGLTLII